MSNATVLRLTNGQQSALECRQYGGLEPVVVAAWDCERKTLTVAPGTRDDLYTEINDYSNAEDAHATILQQEGERALATLTRRASRSLAALAGRILRSSTMDFTVRNEGSIFLLTPHTDAARAWVEEHLPADAQTFGPAIVVEHRYIGDIVAGIQADGLEVR